MRVHLTPQGREIEVEGVNRVSDLLRRLEILPGTVLVIRGDRLLTEDALIASSDTLELRSVVSGGQEKALERGGPTQPGTSRGGEMCKAISGTGR